MTAPGRPRSLLWLAPVLLGATAIAGPAPADEPAAKAEALQVTTFGILALPDSDEADPKLADVLPKLRLLLPGYGFRRVGLKSRRLSGGEALSCPLGEGRSARVERLAAPGENGKVRLRFTLTLAGQKPFVDEITTPLNQLVLIDRMLPGKERLIVGLAAR